MRELYRSYMREFGLPLIFGMAAVLAIVVSLNTFLERKEPTLQVADNEVPITAPVTDDTPGPVMTDSGVPNREIARTSPLSDRDR